MPTPKSKRKTARAAARPQVKTHVKVQETPAPEHLISGADIILAALRDCGVDTIFGYPGGAVLPLYDSLHGTNSMRHILVRHEQGAAHAAEGYARSTGKPGVLLVTSGPGVTNAITGLTDAYLDSIPIICISGQVPTYMIGTDAFQECDATGLTRACTKHNFLVKDVKDLARTVFEAVKIATSGRPGPVLIDVPKNVQLAKAEYKKIEKVYVPGFKPPLRGNPVLIEQAAALMAKAKKPVFYTGGGVINSGPEASKKLRELVKLTGYPITSTLMGLGAYPGEDKLFLGMLGMHGSLEANMAMHDCDVMICIGARFDDRITGRLDAFSPHSKKIHIDVDPASISKNVRADIGIVGDAAQVIEALTASCRKQKGAWDGKRVAGWWKQIGDWRKKDSLKYHQTGKLIKPQYAIDRLYQMTKNKDVYITTEVGQHQMWAAQYFKFKEPNRWMTSGGLGTMGYGLPAAIGVQVAHPDSLVIDIAGEASIQMTMQELSTAVQFRLPVKGFIINNRWMGMVRQWQELIHGGRYSHSYSDSLPDFVKLAEAYGAKGLRAENVDELDGVIEQMIAHDGPVLADIMVVQDENCFPMIPSGAAHNEMILGKDKEADNGKFTKDGLSRV